MSRELVKLSVEAIAGSFIGVVLTLLTLQGRFSDVLRGMSISNLQYLPLEYGFGVMAVMFIVTYYEKFLYEIESKVMDFMLGFGFGAKTYLARRLVVVWVLPASTVLTIITSLYFMGIIPLTACLGLSFGVLTALGYFLIASAPAQKFPKLYVLAGLVIGVYAGKRVLSGIVASAFKSVHAGVFIDPAYIYLLPPDIFLKYESGIMAASLLSAVIFLGAGIAAQYRAIMKLELGTIRS